jgi:hypothetical protein
LAAFHPLLAGYTAEQLAAGLQVGLGAFVLMAALSPPPVWRALSLEPADISPVYALVTFCVVLQPKLGARGGLRKSKHAPA